ncbi:MAG: hypothetical protein B1H03_07370 [Planctomycetales bacterium 4484_113]|nr:MAG: hypothetical protein B1H03_07370 [Planctomycetales bacterium 4484_113]
MRPIKFGTDGWRGIIGFDFTFPRTVLVAEAVRQHLIERKVAERPIVIGYDMRFLADAFAANVANYLKSKGMEAKLFGAPVPTPVCAFAVKHEKAAGALMFTASHNPYYYLGIKFIPEYAGPAESEITDRIGEIIAQLEGEGYSAPELNYHWEGGRYRVKEAYFEQLDCIVNTGAFARFPFRLLYTPLFGCGQGWVEAYLKRHGIEVEKTQTGRDVYFGGQQPDPSPANLAPLAKRLKKEKLDLAVATDGDADRFGMVSSEGRYFGANQLLPVLAEHLVTTRGLAGALVRTLPTSHMLDEVAAAHQLELIETPVGFKYVGRKLRDGALIGGEESGGISVRMHVPEKDAILAIVLALEVMATAGESLPHLWKSLSERYHPYTYERIDVSVDERRKAALMAAVRKMADQSSVFRREIAEVSRIDGLKFVFTDGSWLMLRASGTESVVRAYFESPHPGEFKRLRKDVTGFLREFQE